jgi:hypothetical protein
MPVKLIDRERSQDLANSDLLITRVRQLRRIYDYLRFGKLQKAELDLLEKRCSTWDCRRRRPKKVEFPESASEFISWTRDAMNVHLDTATIFIISYSSTRSMPGRVVLTTHCCSHPGREQSPVHEHVCTYAELHITRGALRIPAAFGES